MKNIIIIGTLALSLLLTGCGVSEDIFDKSEKIDITQIEFVDYETESVALKIDKNFKQNTDLTFTDSERGTTYNAEFLENFDDYTNYLVGEEIGNSRIFDNMTAFSFLSAERETETLELTNNNGQVLNYEVLFMTIESGEVAILATNINNGVLKIKASYTDETKKGIITTYLEEMLKTATVLEKTENLQSDYVNMGKISLKIPTDFKEETPGLFFSENYGLGLNGVTHFNSTLYDEAFNQLIKEFGMMGFEIVSHSEKITTYEEREDGVEVLGGIIEAKMPDGTLVAVDCIFAPEKELMITLAVLSNNTLPMDILENLRNTMIFNN